MAGGGGPVVVAGARVVGVVAGNAAIDGVSRTDVGIVEVVMVGAPVDVVQPTATPRHTSAAIVRRLVALIRVQRTWLVSCR